MDVWLLRRSVEECRVRVALVAAKSGGGGGDGGQSLIDWTYGQLSVAYIYRVHSLSEQRNVQHPNASFTRWTNGHEEKEGGGGRWWGSQAQPPSSGRWYSLQESGGSGREGEPVFDCSLCKFYSYFIKRPEGSWRVEEVEVGWGWWCNSWHFLVN